MEMLENLQMLINEMVGTDGKLSKQEILLKTYFDAIVTCINANKDAIINQVDKKQFETTCSLVGNINDLRAQIYGIKEQLNQISALLEDITKTMCPKERVIDLEVDNEMGVAFETSINYPIVMFAKFVDCNSPIGFCKENLCTDSNSSLFELLITDESHGTYKFVDDNSIQQEVLSAFDPIITSSSQYLPCSTVVSKFVVLESGSIELYGNVWKIINKQKIRLE